MNRNRKDLENNLSNVITPVRRLERLQYLGHRNSVSGYDGSFKMNSARKHRRDSSCSSRTKNPSPKSQNETLFHSLMTDSRKRAKVLELLTKECLVPVNENESPNCLETEQFHNPITSRKRQQLYDQFMKSPIINLLVNKPLVPPATNGRKKCIMESPSAMLRRRALKKLDLESSVDVSADRTDNSQPCGTPMPFEKLLIGVVAYCEVRSSVGDRSAGIKAMMEAMGATVQDSITRGVTHVVFKDGSFTTYQKAKLVNAHLVSVLWLEAIRYNKFRVPEFKYPALGVSAYDANITSLCQSMQPDYDDVVRDEVNKRHEQSNDMQVRNSDFVTKRKIRNVNEFSDSKQNMDISLLSKIHPGSTFLDSTSNKKQCTLSDNESISCDSFLSSTKRNSCNMDIIPFSQMEIATQNKKQVVELTDESDIDSNGAIAKLVKDSFELNKAQEIRSPDSLLKNKSLKKRSVSSKISLDDDFSLRLHITTTDDSNATSNKSKSLSNCAQRSLGFAGPSSDNKNDSLRKKSCGSKVGESEKNSYLDKPKSRKNLCQILGPSKMNTSISDTNLEQQKSGKSIPKGTRKTMSNVDLMKHKYALSSDDDGNENMNVVVNSKNKIYEKSDLPQNFGKTNKSVVNIRKTTRKTMSCVDLMKQKKSLEILNSNSHQSENMEVDRTKTVRYLNTQEIDLPENFEKLESVRDIQKTLRKTMSSNDLLRILSSDDDNNENVEAFNNSKYVKNQNNRETVRPKKFVKTKKSRTMSTADLLNLLSADADENVNKEMVDNLDLQENLGDYLISRTINKPRIRKLYRADQSIDENLFDWDEKINSKKLGGISPTKRLKYHVAPTDQKTTKILPSNAMQSLSKNTQNVSDPSDVNESPDNVLKITKIVNQNTGVKGDDIVVNRRKSLRIQASRNSVRRKSVETKTSPKRSGVLNESEDDSSVKFLKPRYDNIPILKTPSKIRNRKSMRHTSAKITKILETDKNVHTTPRVNTKTPSKSTLKTMTPSKAKTISKANTPRKKDIYENKIVDKVIESAERRSTLEFVQKPSRQYLEQVKLTQKSTHVLKVDTIACTRLHRPDVQIFEQIVRKLGGFIIEEEVTNRTTHLVAGGPARTINMLRAIARGCWVLKQEWLFKSLEAGKWLDEEEYELTTFSPAVQKCRLERQTFGSLYSMDVFKDCGNIYICRSSIPRCSDLEELIVLCGGTIVKAPRQAQIVVGETFRYDNLVCVSEKWVLECITYNKKKSLKYFLLEHKFSTRT